jgi:hypothetical protein
MRWSLQTINMHWRLRDLSQLDQSRGKKDDRPHREYYAAESSTERLLVLLYKLFALINARDNLIRLCSPIEILPYFLHSSSRFFEIYCIRRSV